MPFDPNAPFTVKGFDPNQPYEVVEPPRGRTVAEAVKDTAIDTGIGIVKFGEGVVGAADLATGNLAGKGLSYLGYDPASTVQTLSGNFSDPRKRANQEVAEAEGFWGKISALVDNPSVAFGSIVQSAPMAAGGAAVARTVATRMLGTALAESGIEAGSVAARTFAKGFFADPAVKSSIIRAGAAAEGAQSAGLIQEEGRQGGREWSDTILPAVAAGAGTAAIGLVSSKIPGLRDAEASLATAGLTAREAGGGVGKAIIQSAKEVGKSVVKEGPLEEMPQSGWEEANRNVAMGRPAGQHVPEAMGEGLVVGAAQGGMMTTASEAINAVQPAQVIPIDKTKPSNMAVVAANISEADREHAEQTAMAERMAGLDSTIDGIDSKVAGKPVDFSKMKELPGNAYTANRGRPFVSESALRAHARVKGVDLAGHEIVPFDGGFVGVPPQAQEETKQGGAQDEGTGDDIPDWSTNAQKAQEPGPSQAQKPGPSQAQGPLKDLRDNDPFSDDYDPDLYLKHQVQGMETALRGQQDKAGLDAIYDDIQMAVEKRPDLQPFADHLYAAYAEHAANLEGMVKAEAERGNAEAERSKAEERKKFPRTAGMSLDTEGGRHVDDKVTAQAAVRESKEKALMAKFGLKGFPSFDPANAPISSETAGAGAPAKAEPYSEADARKKFPGLAGMSLDTDGNRLVDTKVEAQTAVRASKEKALMARYGLKGTPVTDEKQATPEPATPKPEDIPNVERHETIENADSAANAQVVNTAPSDAQKEAGNYKKAHVKLDGLDISVENPAGYVRSGTDKDGKAWQTEMKADYGYIKGSQGYDKDHVDVFMSPGYQGGAEQAYVVNQFGDGGKGEFDEHKVVLGANSEAEALKVYNSNYEAGWKGGKYVTAMPMEEFKEWAKSEEPQAGALMRNNTQAAHSLHEEKPQVAGQDQQAERNAFTGSKKEAILAQLRRRVGDERKEFPGTDKENLSVANVRTSNVRTPETPNIADPPGAETVTGAVSDGVSGPSDADRPSWQMTPAEYTEGITSKDEKAIRLAAHPQAVKSAIARDEKVPLPVLQAYQHNQWAKDALVNYQSNKKEEKSQGDVSGQPANPGTSSSNIDMVEHTTRTGKIIRGIVRTDLSHAGAMAIDKYTFKKDGGWFIREEHLSPTGHPQGKRDGADHGAGGITQNSRQSHEEFPGWYYVVNHTLGEYKQRGKFKATFLQEKPDGDFFPANGFGDTAEQALDNAIAELEAAQKRVKRKKDLDRDYDTETENIDRLKTKLFEARRQARAALKPEVKAKAEAKVEEIEQAIRKARQRVFDDEPAQANDEPTLIIHSLQTGKEEELKLPPRKKAEPEATSDTTSPVDYRAITIERLGGVGTKVQYAGEHTVNKTVYTIQEINDSGEVRFDSRIFRPYSQFKKAELPPREKREEADAEWFDDKGEFTLAGAKEQLARLEQRRRDIEHAAFERGQMPVFDSRAEQKLREARAIVSRLEAEQVATRSAPADIAKQVTAHLSSGKALTSADLFKISDKAYGGTQAEGKYTPKDAYDALELGINQHLAGEFSFKSDNPVERIRELETLLSRVPTQTKRTKEQDDFQQYSTPPTLGYVASWAANLNKNDSFLEPSAGIGGLAVFGKMAGVKTITVNELSERRRNILKEMGFSKVYGENAEQLHNVLPGEVKPTVIIMNPPFSSTGGRLSKNKTQYGAGHIEQALKRLEPSGRLVAIVGEGMADGKSTFRDWWKKISAEYTVRANVGMAGDGYRKYGTTFDNQILVIDKAGPTNDTVITGKVDNYADLIPLLQGVRDDRTVRAAVAQQESAEQTGKGETSASKPEAESGPAVLPTAPGMGAGQRNLKDQSGDRGQDRSDAAVEAGDLDERSDQSEPGGRGSGRDAGRKNLSQGSGVEAAGLDREPAPNTDQLETTRQEKQQQQSADSVFEGYQPTIIVNGAKPHPADLVESAAMAAVKLPNITYRPNLPKEVVTSGRLSEVQLEAITAAGQAHQDTLPNGETRGFFIGDGTGVGKGREIAGILFDNWNQGRKKSIWISKDRTLAKDAKRDINGIGWSGDLLIEQGSTKAGQAIPDKDGVLYTAYSTVSSSAKEGQLSRLQAIIDWAGPDFDGVIAFDESHKMGNAISIKDGRFTKKPSQMALAALDLQRALPKAKIVYVSATGATEVSNLAYAERLGLWGEGTSFANATAFIGKISQGGIAAMEVVARDMKAMGSYLARKLAYNGKSKAYQVKYRRLEHELSGQQREIYDELAGAWQLVLQNIDEALQITEADSNGKSQALSAFWGSHQRFFNQVLTAMQMPSVITSIKQDIKDGKAIVLQITNTNEASTNRALANAESLEDVDITPRDQLMQMIENSFPVRQYEKYEDDDGNIRTRPVVDSNGDPVVNRDAVAKREELLDKLGSVKVPDAPLDQILNVFGVDKVAEVTGRSKRIVTIDDGTGPRKIRQGWSKMKGVADAAQFMADKKQILIFSEAGGTGASYHADNAAINQRQRSHYILQAGWRADSAVQGLGRSHRSNQAIAPEYVLVTTDLKGHKRFISSIARKLSQLGALTEGERTASSQGLFTERDNLESEYAADAVQQLIGNVHRGMVRGIDMPTLVRELGIPNLVDEHGQLNTTQMPTVPRFLNRILSMKIDMQNKVFDMFSTYLDANVTRAEENGTLDVGLETLKAKAIRVVDKQPVHVDQKSGAVTEYVQLDVDHQVEKRQFDPKSKVAVNNKSNMPWQVLGEKSITTEAGEVVDVIILRNGRSAVRNVPKADFGATFQVITSNKEAREIWNKGLAAIPDTVTQREHLITGALLPIWDKLIGHPRIVRVQTGKETMLGRMISGDHISDVMALLDVEGKAVEMTPEQAQDTVLKNGQTLTLDNKWKITRRRVAGENRMEVEGTGYGDHNILSNYGAFTERINYVTRNFIPVGEAGNAVLDRILKNHKVLTVSGKASSEEVLYSKGEALPASEAADVKGEIHAAGAGALLESGMVVIISPEEALKLVTGPAQAKYSKDGRIQGIVSNGKIYLVQGGISRGRVWDVLVHEEGTHVGKLLHEEPEFKALLRTIELRKGEQSETGEAIRKAFAEVPAETDPGLVTEEALAYLVEHHPDTSVTRKLIALVKRLLVKMGISPDIFTAADLRALAEVAVRVKILKESSKPAEQGKVEKDDVRLSVAADSPMSLESLEEIAQQMGSITYIKNKKPDSTFLDRILSTPEYYFKKFGAAGRVLQAALARRDIRFVKEKEILGGFVEFVQDLRKTNGEAYTEANEYLLTADREATGFRIKPTSDEESWQVKAPKWARKDGEDEVIGTFEKESEAVKAMIEAEGKAMIEHGYSAAAVEAVQMARELTNRGFDTMAADMRKIIAEARENGLPDPFVGDGQIDEAGRYAVYAAGKKMPIALFASEAEAEAMLQRAAEMISYVVLGTKKGGERSFKTELKAKQWAARHSGTVKGQPMFANLVVKKRTDAEMRPLTVAQALAQIGDLRGIYFPRIREAGEYVLIAERAGANSIRKHFDIPTVGDGHPKLQKVLGMVTPIGREARRLKAMGYTITIKRDNSTSEDVFEATNLVSSLDAILQDSMKVIDKNSDTQVRSGQHINQILTMQIADIFKSRGYLSSRIRRLEGDAVWEGYEEDMGRALIQYGKNVAAGTAKRDTARAMVLAFSGRDYSWAEYKAEVENPDWTEYQEIVEKRRIDPRTQKNLFRDVRTFMVDVLRNDEQADRIMGVMKGLAVLKYLGFRVSSAAVNLTNMVQGVPATIAGHTGEPLHKAFGRVTAAAAAYGKYRSGKGDLSEADKDIFRYISEQGWDEAQFNYEAAKELRSKLGESWNKFMVASMFMFGAAEKANRAMTIFAAYKAVREKEATAEESVIWEKAKEISDRAHGVYGKETIPAWARGKLNPLRLTYTFQKFGHNYMLNMLDLGFNKKEYKAAAYMLLSPALLAGSGASLAGPVLFALAGAIGIGGDDPEEKWYKWADQTFGAGAFARHGLFGVAGINIKGSLAMNLPMPADIGNAKLTDLAGPAGGVLTDTAKGITHLLKGDVAKGTEFLLPTAFGSMSKATREATEGITTSNYGTVFYGDEPLRADAVDAFLRFMSFNPARLSGIREKQWNEKEVAARYQEEKSEIYANIKRLHLKGKRITPEILKTIKVYNDRISDSGREDLSPITPKTIKTMLRRNDTASKVERMRAAR